MNKSRMHSGQSALLVVVALVFALLLAIPASAGWSNNEPVSLYRDEFKLYQPVGYLTWCGDCVNTDYKTREPWVVNPTPCVWDVDDYFFYRSSGNLLASGAELAYTECRYTSGQKYPQWFTFVVFLSPSPDLIVTMAYEWADGQQTVAIQPERLNQGYRYRACVVAPIATGTPLTEVPGSHGGSAVYQTFTVTIKNPGGKTGRSGGRFGAGIIPWIREECPNFSEL